MTTWDLGHGVVQLPDGRRVRGIGRLQARGDAPEPEVALYLLEADPGTQAWEHLWIEWPDFSLPVSTPDAVATLRRIHEVMASHRVEISCAGGTGRTGTALSVLAIMSGVRAEDAVAWVRRHYRPRAVETAEQERWVLRTATAYLETGPRPDPPAPR
ncbi:protein-tyrosine phosphatase family protein [Pseudactinotalea sp. Z1739]|uniref:protein-tyrosine phosphatase family protein n=1 Tax=Pseudactinotalea sp. Z1739 TaxID=3413028 RepID=UPI003C7AEE3D